ncbi:MAG: ATP-binding cassette domain-containing protein [Bacilli bacterium]|nr:ATP-binding cassette domain-containing protein [Bacilli bacterium]
MAKIELRHLYKVYSNSFKSKKELKANNYEVKPAVSDFSMDIDDGEFVVFVGPSGCGKSTTLRMIAGLETITDGTLTIDNEVMNKVEAKDRNISMVFQNYALYPNMNVFNNMAFPLKIRKHPVPVFDKEGNRKLVVDKEQIESIKEKISVLKKEDPESKEIEKLKQQIAELKLKPSKPAVRYVHYTKTEIKENVEKAAEILELTQYLDRKPAALSGGQRQRVALGRALVRDPKIFLLDEPLSNLDAKLRSSMRVVITKLHNQLKTVFIYVTHDQVEAMTMGTKIVVMKDGFIQQIGTPDYLYNHPYNKFVAGFIGTPQMNFFNGEIEKNGTIKFANNLYIKLDAKEISRLVDIKETKEIILGIRPEDVHLVNKQSKEKFDCVFDAKLDVLENLGSETLIYCNMNEVESNKLIESSNDIKLISKISSKLASTDKNLKFGISMKDIHIFDKETSVSLFKDIDPGLFKE